MRASTRGMARRRGAVDQPFATNTHRRLALELRLAVEALIGAASPGTYHQLAKIFAALVRVGMACPALDAGNAAMDAVCDRFERVGKVGVSKAEAAALRRSIAGIDAALPLLPFNRVAQAIEEVKVYCAADGA